MTTQFVAPQAGSGGVNLRSRAQVDPATCSARSMRA